MNYKCLPYLVRFVSWVELVSEILGFFKVPVRTKAGIVLVTAPASELLLQVIWHRGLARPGPGPCG